MSKNGSNFEMTIEMENNKNDTVEFEGAENFRLRIVFSILSGRKIVIRGIRSGETEPGLREHEILFLRLIDTISNGSEMTILYTGTELKFLPGNVEEGEYEHKCVGECGIGYFMESIMYLSSFSSGKLKIIFTGKTIVEGRDSVEMIRWGMIPLLCKFGNKGVRIIIDKHEFGDDDEGKVVFFSDNVLRQVTDVEMDGDCVFSLIRGVVYGLGVPGDFSGRIIESCKKVLRRTKVPIKLSVDMRKTVSGKTSGYGMLLAAELKEGWRICTESAGKAGEICEDFGEKVAYNLLYELDHSVLISLIQIPFVLTYMVLGLADIKKLRIDTKQINANIICCIRDIKKIFGSEIFFKEYVEARETLKKGKLMEIILKGTGYKSISKKNA